MKVHNNYEGDFTSWNGISIQGNHIITFVDTNLRLEIATIPLRELTDGGRILVDNEWVD